MWPGMLVVICQNGRCLHTSRFRLIQNDPCVKLYFKQVLLNFSNSSEFNTTREKHDDFSRDKSLVYKLRGCLLLLVKVIFAKPVGEGETYVGLQKPVWRSI
jgi:hypothetical protein